MYEKSYCVYFMTNRWDTVLYIGVTSNLSRRVFQHKNHHFKGFTSKYNLNKLVYYEQYQLITNAIKREKQLKKWKRSKKNYLVNQHNPK